MNKKFQREFALDEVLESVWDMSSIERQNFLTLNFPDKPNLIYFIDDIIAANKKASELSFSSTVANLAQSEVEEFDPYNHIDKKIDHWLITDVISVTSKNAVLKATPADGDHCQIVAIKIESPAFREISGGKHIKMQAYYMDKLKCRNMVELKHATTSSDDIDYVVMEYLPGLNIVEHCVKNDLSPELRLNLYAQLLDGVEYMHSKMVSHRDLKPQNVYLDYENTPKIIDLDLARAEDENFNGNHEYKNIDGYTSLYAAPEQLNVDKEISAQCDIFALGRILYEMLMGDLNVNVHDPLGELVSKYGKQLNLKELAAIIKKASHPNIKKRYQSVTALKMEINTFIEGRYIVEAYKNESTRPYNIYKTIKRNFTMLSVFFVIFVTVFASGAGFALRYVEEQRTLNIMIRSQDPRQVEARFDFDHRANEIFINPAFFNSRQYELLLMFGDVYLGRGQPNKAIDFFKEAIRLYPDSTDDKHIVATTKLSATFYQKGDPQTAISHIAPYMPNLFEKKLSNPALIRMFLQTIEINAQQFHLNLLGDYNDEKVSQVLNNMDMGSIVSDKEKAKLILNKKFYSAVLKYYSSSEGDYASLDTMSREETYQKESRPMLLEVKDELLASISLIKKNNIISDMEPLINLWLAHVSAELRQYSEIDGYMQKGIAQTKDIFGEFHPRVVEGYGKGFAAYRWFAPEKALQAAINSSKALGEPTKETLLKRFFPAMLVVNSYQYMGVFSEANHVIEKTEAIEPDQNRWSSNDYDSIGNMVYIHMQLNMRQDYTSENIIKYAHYEKVLLDYGGMKEVLFASLILKDSLTESQKIIADKIEKQTIHIENISKTEYSRRADYILFAELCLNNPHCNSVDYLKKAEEFEEWTLRDKKYSTELFATKVKSANIYAHLGATDKAEELINTVTHIVLSLKLKDNAFYAQYHYIKAMIEYKRGNISKAIEHAKMSMPGARHHIGKSSKTVSLLREILEQSNNYALAPQK